MNEKHMDNDHAPQLEPELAAAVWAVVSEPVDAEAIQRVKRRAKEQGAKELPPPVRQSWKAPAWFALAASVLVVAGATLMLPAAPSAFGQVMAQLRATGAFRYTSLIFQEGSAKPIETQELVAEDGRQRSEVLETVTIRDRSGQIRITLLNRVKHAIVGPGDAAPAAPDAGLHDWLEALRSHRDRPDRRLPGKLLEGRRVEGFVVRSGPHEFTLWIDEASDELVQLEFGPLVEGSSIAKVVLKDFRFNQNLDDALFSFDVPAGYETRQLNSRPQRMSGEQHLVEALRYYTKSSDGKFPNSISNWGEWAVRFSSGGALSKEAEQAMGHLGGVTPFLFSKSADDYEYLGKGKTTSEERSIVFWWRDDVGQLRAIYNDLTIDEVTAEDLPAGDSR